MSKKVIIIGAGIGGLCTAIALIKEGYEVKVFEKAAQLTHVGAGIVLAANALKALGTLGVEKNVVSSGAHVGKAEIRSWDGKLIVELPTHEQANRYGTYSYLIHRAKLVSILVNKLNSNTKIQLNKKLVKFTQTENKVTAFFEDGTNEDADILIGADGIHSLVRKQLFGEEKLRYAGFTAFRGICDIANSQYQMEDGGGFEAWGRGKRFGFSHLGEGKVFWFAAINSQEGKQTQPEGRKEIVKKYFEDWYPPVQLAIDATEETSILHHDIYDLPPITRWSKGRVTLLGDAAHPMLPNLGQGGAQAIEDAIVLSQSLKGIGSLQGALQSYEHTRKQRTRSIINQSRKMARMVQLENPLTIHARNIVLKNIPKKLITNRLDWILGHKVK
ncbi:FAD-dependent monooxygenase [Fredinandcohnia sp. 179-A 10B2 NHS]|uniref:FAD-dependent monooxygenase n=1 Tax=Fredinandcohnia sp. 179-A 10B2 NHS TaxID=3235176 RepID=UPI0039A3C7A5